MKKANAARLCCTFFDSALGQCAVLWNDQVICRVQLPEKTPALTKSQIRQEAGPFIDRHQEQAPEWVKRTIKLLQTLLDQGSAELRAIPIDLSSMPKFFRAVYEAVSTIPPGQTASYGEIADWLGSPKAARAVGQAMRRNPLPLIIPCHRVTAAGGKLGGFSAGEGVVTKQQLLALERSAILNWQEDWSGSLLAACQNLKTLDPQLAQWMLSIGPCQWTPKPTRSLFAALLEAIVYQQLHAKAASTIHSRFLARWGGQEHCTPAQVLACDDMTLRAVGLSSSKLQAIKDLAQKIGDGVIPELSILSQWSDDAIVTQLTQVRGIGPWTAEMLLIFNLARRDVLPVTDYGIRKGFARAFKQKELPSPAALAAYGQRWRPFRSIASWYLWKIADLD